MKKLLAILLLTVFAMPAMAQTTMVLGVAVADQNAAPLTATCDRGGTACGGEKLWVDLNDPFLNGQHPFSSQTNLAKFTNGMFVDIDREDIIILAWPEGVLVSRVAFFQGDIFSIDLGGGGIGTPQVSVNNGSTFSDVAGFVISPPPVAVRLTGFGGPTDVSVTPYVTIVDLAALNGGVPVNSIQFTGHTSELICARPDSCKLDLFGVLATVTTADEPPPDDDNGPTRLDCWKKGPTHNSTVPYEGVQGQIICEFSGLDEGRKNAVLIVRDLEDDVCRDADGVQIVGEDCRIEAKVFTKFSVGPPVSSE